VRADPGFLPNELLPDTVSEMAVPLVVGDQFLGILDVQSDEQDYFSEQDVNIFTTLASQVAVALQNAHQYEQTQAALEQTEQSQQLLRSIIDATPDWIFIKDQDHRYRLANKGYADALHMQADDFIGKNDLELGFPEELVLGDPKKDIRGFWADDRLVMDSGEAQVYPNDPATIDDEVHIFHTYKTPLWDDEGNVWGVLAFSRDITEREQLLADTENLYQASAELNLAETYDEILSIIRKYTLASESQTTTVNLFDRPWSEEDIPEWIYTLSHIGELPAEVFSERYKISDFPSAYELLRPDRPTIVEDLNSPDIDENARYLYTQIFKTGSTIFIPFVVGGRWIGYCNALFGEARKFESEDIRRFTAIAGQAAVAVQNIFSVEQIRARARRERLLREITTNVRGSVDPDAILRTAVRELGDALGRKAFVRLGSADELSQKPQNILEGEGGNHGGNGNQGDEGG
jgi:GAF domain-containing protein